MASITFKRKYHIHEVIGATSANESYMITDPETGCGLAAVDEKPGVGTTVAKAFFDKLLLPSKFEMVSSEGSLIFEMCQPASLIKPVFTVKTSEGRILCSIKSNSNRLNPCIDVLDERGQLVGSVTSSWRVQDFDFNDMTGKPIAKIHHCNGGFIRDTFTTADDYDVEMLIEVPDSGMAAVALAVTVAIDTWYHE